jgi:NAD(P)-dependent dehydrogenase (short-subunit alcohol dehydrogenase family)
VARLEAKTCLVTGAATGIGRGIADRFIAEGARVAFADIDLDTARAAAEPHGSSAIALALDVTGKAGWQAAVSVVEAAFGGLNVLVNNAGICIPGSVESLAEDDWHRTIDVDLNSVFLGCRHALPVMARHAPGSIINIASISAVIAGHNFAAYNAAKAGVNMLTKSVALHSARKAYGVRANAILPAFIDTRMVDDVVRADTPAAAREKLARQVPIGRIGNVDDVAWATVYLASEESSFMTGSEIRLDGGLSAM